MSETTATQFCRNFGLFQREAQREPVQVTSHGRTTGFFVSEADFAHYQSLLRRERHVLLAGQLPEDVVAAIEASEYPDGFEHLDSLLDDEGR